MATILANEINATDRDLTGPIELVQNWDVDEQTIKESRILCDITRRIGK